MTIIFKTKIWVWQGGKASWYFVTLPHDDAVTLKLHHAFNVRGFGSIRVQAKIGNTTWQTSVFPSTKDKSYILPIKTAVRRSENITKDDIVTIELKTI